MSGGEDRFGLNWAGIGLQLGWELVEIVYGICLLASVSCMAILLTKP